MYSPRKFITTKKTFPGVWPTQYAKSRDWNMEFFLGTVGKSYNQCKWTIDDWSLQQIPPHENDIPDYARSVPDASSRNM
jgi:hypothetical protein